MESPTEKLDELEDVEYLVELSEAMEDEDIAVVALAVGNIIYNALKLKKE